MELVIYIILITAMFILEQLVLSIRKDQIPAAIPVA